MNFDEASQRHAQLKARLHSGELKTEEYAAAVSELLVQDTDGNYWAIDPQAGDWLLWNGQAWIRSAAAPTAQSAVQSAGRAGRPGQCPACQALLSPESAFCSECGSPSGEASPRQSASTPRSPIETMGSSVMGVAGKTLRIGQMMWDVITMAGSTGMAGLWYWYSGMAETRPDIKSCTAMIVVPLILIFFRKQIDRLLMPLQKIRKRIPRMALLGAGLAIPFLVSNLLYAKGYSQFDYLFKTYVGSTLLSYIVMRTPQVGSLIRVATTVAGGTDK